ncbi:hypothetical protein RRG08_012141 [Elysia crispata]|uniref:PiggyBac transposable element-derived protein domain-containing protein n=1 Tax=Elysia crispata TaxID=231223 RepID=A0AAE1ACD6_9GAST|nr:hypothetical protein RRG08_012141 [Elysia crispata]
MAKNVNKKQPNKRYTVSEVLDLLEDCGDYESADVRPLFNLMNEQFQKYFQQEENLSVDESMIPYFGRHSAKQFIKGKPIRYGYKVWILTTSLGYAINLIPYQGAATVKALPGLGMGGQVVLDLVTALSQNCFHVTFDNLFSSLALAEELTRRGLACTGTICTGTIRANRTGDCPILDTKTMEKKARGSYDFKADNEKGMIMTRWNDNNVVTLLSNKYGVEPLGTASRWSKKEGQRVAVPQPNVVKHYNSTMGGVDRLDQNVGLYRCGINSKKWWWPTLLYLIDMCVQQTWQLYRRLHESAIFPKDQLARCIKCQVGVHDRCFAHFHSK